MNQNEPIKQDHHKDQHIESNIEETEGDIDSGQNPKKDGKGLLAAHQAQAKWEELIHSFFIQLHHRDGSAKYASNMVKGHTGYLKLYILENTQTILRKTSKWQYS